MGEAIRKLRSLDKAWWLALAAAAVALWLALPAPRPPTPFQAANTAYLEGASKKALTMLVPVGVIKGLADVVEGSTVDMGVSLGVSGKVTVEAGDIMQPVLDIATAIWKTLFIDNAYLLTMLMLLQVSGAIALPALLAALLAGLAGVLARRRLAAGSPALAVLNRATRLFALVFLLVEFVFPCTIRFTAALSGATTEPYRTAQQDALRRLSRVYEGSVETTPPDSNFLDGVSARFKRAGQTARATAASLATVSAALVAIFVLEGIVFPLLSFAFLVWFVRSCLAPVIGLGEPRGKADLAAIAAWVKKGREAEAGAKPPQP